MLALPFVLAGCGQEEPALVTLPMAPTSSATPTAEPTAVPTSAPTELSIQVTPSPSPTPESSEEPSVSPLPTAKLTEGEEALTYTHSGYGYSIDLPLEWKPFIEVYREGDALAVQFIGESEAGKGSITGAKRGMNLFTIKAVTEEELKTYADPAVLAEKYDTTFIAYVEPNLEKTLLDPSPSDEAVQAALKAEDRQNYMVMVAQKDAALATFTLQ